MCLKILAFIFSIAISIIFFAIFYFRESNKFGAKTTWEVTKDLENVMKDKVILITGANSGLGLETARVSAAKKAKVIITCRSDSKCKEAKNMILHEFPNAHVDTMNLDLLDYESARNFADKLQKKNMIALTFLSQMVVE